MSETSSASKTADVEAGGWLPDSPHASLVVFVLALLWLKILLLCAWQGDDAYITHRTAYNIVAGHGPVWNVGERVQSFTSPLWLAVSTLCQGVFGEVFFSVLAVSVGIVAWALWELAFKQSVNWRLGLLGVLALSCSNAVVDFAACGLENPLLYLLILLGLRAASQELSSRSVLVAGLLVSAVALTRTDALVLVGLPLLAMVSRSGSPRELAAPLALAASPFLAWELFSYVYYGSWVPNTALAKLNLDIPKTELVEHGFRYFAWTLTHDPVTVPLIFGGLAVALRWGDRVERASAAGLGLYMLYLLRIGGDFMGGRFFAAPAVLACALLARTLPPRWLEGRRLKAVALCFVVLGLGRQESRWLTDAFYGEGMSQDEVVSEGGVADERAYYQPSAGLMRVLLDWPELRAEGAPIPPYRRAYDAQRFRGQYEVLPGRAVGFYGYFLGPDTYVQDVFSLCDPLLARLIFRRTPDWRTGHYPRPRPEGYYESLEAGRNLVVDPGLHALYEDIRIVTRAPVFSPGRFDAIRRLNGNHHRAAVAAWGR